VQDAITLTQQLKYYKEYQSKLAAVVGRAILADALYVVSTGTGDFLQNYYHNASLSRRYNVDQYCDLLVGIFSGFANVRHRPDQIRDSCISISYSVIHVCRPGRPPSFASC
jgi:hypothetical protein